MEKLQEHLTVARLFLTELPPLYALTPWVLLAAVFWAFDKALDATGTTAKLERAVPWGNVAARFLDTVPFIILGAAWPLVSSGDAAMTSAVMGAMAAAARPLFLAVKQWVADRRQPPTAVLVFALALTLPTIEGCSQQQAAKTASHLASNAASTALIWTAATVRAKFEAESQAKIAELEQAGASVTAWEDWFAASGWKTTIAAVDLGFQGHALIVAHLDGSVASTAEKRAKALAAIQQAVTVGLAELERRGVQVPPYVHEAVKQLPTLGALL